MNFMSLAACWSRDAGRHACRHAAFWYLYPARFAQAGCAQVESTAYLPPSPVSLQASAACSALHSGRTLSDSSLPEGTSVNSASFVISSGPKEATGVGILQIAITQIQEKNDA